MVFVVVWLQAKNTFNKFAYLFGRMALNLFYVIRYSLQLKIDSKEFLFHGARIAYDTLPIVLLSTAAIGVVVGIQLAPEFAERGLGSNLGVTTAVAMTREVAPIIGSLVIATQYAAGITAEFANMKVTEQIDALKILKVNPLEFLVVPRALAALIFVPFVIFLGALGGVLATFVTSNLTEQIALNGFSRTIWEGLAVSDVYICLFKAAVFGLMVIMIAATIGLETKGGAKEVGRATTLSVLANFVATLVVDYIISAVYL